MFVSDAIRITPLLIAFDSVLSMEVDNVLPMEVEEMVYERVSNAIVNPLSQSKLMNKRTMKDEQVEELPVVYDVKQVQHSQSCAPVEHVADNYTDTKDEQVETEDQDFLFHIAHEKPVNKGLMKNEWPTTDAIVINTSNQFD